METNTITLVCWVHGYTSSFPVDIDRNKIIGHLKEAIVTEKPNRFNGLDADQLELCVANIPDTEEAMRGFTFGNALRGSDTIQDIVNEHFQGSLPRKTIHIAIQRPADERPSKKAKTEEFHSDNAYKNRIKKVPAPSDVSKNWEQNSDKPTYLDHRPASATGIPTELQSTLAITKLAIAKTLLYRKLNGAIIPFTLKHLLL
ncbi:hypothetical protein BDZ91DRAFT_725897 [Kalaharituber pfeilii]|nr:hypothetical protein BDZ91DRAFT_725897 [Kalaharituber pfeilii]